jgi:GT2 family glycosyltransferase
VNTPPVADVQVTLVLWHSDPQLVAATCAALARQTTRLSTLRVLVNESDRHEAEAWAGRLRAIGPAGRVLVQASAGNAGFAGGHNRLLAQAFASGADHALIVNPDLALEEKAVERLLDFAVSLPGPSICGPVLELARLDDGRLSGLGTLDTVGIRWTRTGRHLDAGQGQPLSTAPHQPHAVAGVSGACMLVTAGAHERFVRESGEFFDEDFIAYREDAELGLRAAMLGVALWVVPQARGLHVRTQRGTRRGGSAFVDRLGVRNRFLIAFKYGTRRPGGWCGAPLRDVTVLIAVMLRERSSWVGVREAFGLRSRMHRKRATVRAAAAGYGSSGGSGTRLA